MMVRVAGVEPALLSELDFESSASTNSTTLAHSPPILAVALCTYTAPSAIFELRRLNSHLSNLLNLLLFRPAAKTVDMVDKPLFEGVAFTKRGAVAVVRCFQQITLPRSTHLCGT